MKMEFIGEGPALVIEGGQRMLVVADLHFGIEADLAAHGLHFKSRSERRLERLHKVIDSTKPDELVLLGDVKHSIPSLTWQEYYELPKILDSLRTRLPLHVFPGNHDIGIERFLHEGEIRPKDGAVLDGVGYLHGHMIPSPALTGHLVVIGHHHPLLSLRDEVGCALQSPAYLRAGINTGDPGMEQSGKSSLPSRVLFMPSFNEIAGYDILQIIKKPFSPLSRLIQKEDTEIILADGTYIGPLRALIPDEAD
ncbi:MAG: metallophosphoesterase [Methanoregula sp.]|nr:metallophosphoesterase [Methanoregula sp.]